MKMSVIISLLFILQRISFTSENEGRDSENDDLLADYSFMIDDDPAIDGCDSGQKGKGKEERLSPQLMSSRIAQNAVIVATAASTMQNVAAAQASRLVREQLAEKAAQAARAAEAELNSKQDFIESLELQSKKAKKDLIDKAHYLQTASAQVRLAEKVRREAEDQYGTLKRAIDTAAKNLDHSESTAMGAMAGLNMQKDVLISRKCHLQKLMAALKKARLDLDKAENATKQIMKDSQEIIRNLESDEGTNASSEEECADEEGGETSKEIPEDTPTQSSDGEWVEDKPKESLEPMPEKSPKPKPEKSSKVKSKPPKKKPTKAPKVKCKPKKKPKEKATEPPEENAEESPEESSQESLEEELVDPLKDCELKDRNVRRNICRIKRNRNFRRPR